MIGAAVITIDAYLEVVRERDEARAALLVLHHQHLEALESAMRQRACAAEAQRDEAVSRSHESLTESVRAKADAARLREALQASEGEFRALVARHDETLRQLDAAQVLSARLEAELAGALRERDAARVERSAPLTPLDHIPDRCASVSPDGFRCDRMAGHGGAHESGVA